MRFLPFTPRYILLTIALGLLALVGLRDLSQTKHAILRNYPIAAHLRFLSA